MILWHKPLGPRLLASDIAKSQASRSKQAEQQERGARGKKEKEKKKEKGAGLSGGGQHVRLPHLTLPGNSTGKARPSPSRTEIVLYGSISV